MNRPGLPRVLRPAGGVLLCGHCGVPLRPNPGRAGRYALEAWGTPDTAILGSGSECPANDRGHQVTP